MPTRPPVLLPAAMLPGAGFSAFNIACDSLENLIREDSRLFPRAAGSILFSGVSTCEIVLKDGEVVVPHCFQLRGR
jgi:hypothetical protein